MEHADRLLNVTSEGQAALREVLRESLQRIEWEDDFRGPRLPVGPQRRPRVAAQKHRV